jgi:RNA polymerase sigma-70 factor (ECF subfamily)
MVRYTGIDSAAGQNWAAVDRPVRHPAGVGTSMGTMTMDTGLAERAQTGDGEAFRQLTDPYRRELQVHCYRMLGSVQDAEDALQDTLLSAWQGFGGFEGRASLRTWLYRIATNRCLNLRRSAARRPAQEWNVAAFDPPEPSRLGEISWLQPYPDALLADGQGLAPGPEVRYERAESISLAFVTALQVLPPRQLAVLILRDVLGFRASEVAGMLDASLDSVNSALKRARASLQQRLPADREPPPASDSAAEEAVVARFVRAYEAADLDALVALLTDDVFMSMPPLPFEYEGRDAVARFCARIFGAGRTISLVPTRANGQPAFGSYAQAPDGHWQATGLVTIALSGDRICATSRFETVVLPWFGLPRTMPPAAVHSVAEARYRRQ